LNPEIILKFNFYFEKLLKNPCNFRTDLEFLSFFYSEKIFYSLKYYLYKAFLYQETFQLKNNLFSQVLLILKIPFPLLDQVTLLWTVMEATRVVTQAVHPVVHRQSIRHHHLGHPAKAAHPPPIKVHFLHFFLIVHAIRVIFICCNVIHTIEFVKYIYSCIIKHYHILLNIIKNFITILFLKEYNKALTKTQALIRTILKNSIYGRRETRCLNKESSINRTHPDRIILHMYRMSTGEN